MTCFQRSRTVSFDFDGASIVAKRPSAKTQCLIGSMYAEMSDGGNKLTVIGEMIDEICHQLSVHIVSVDGIVEHQDESDLDALLTPDELVRLWSTWIAVSRPSEEEKKVSG